MFKKFADGFQSTLAQAGEQAKARNGLGGIASPRQSTSIERPIASKPLAHVPYEDGNMESDNDEEHSQPTQSFENNGDPPQDSITIAPDLQKRLNKLSKYEKKYPELLKAYRALQVQDVNVKAFEKVLGEITPATSILDVEAFQQWTNNFTLKANMSTEELRRVSKELDDLQNEVNVKASQHVEETTRLKNRIVELEQFGRDKSTEQGASLSDLDANVEAPVNAEKLELVESQRAALEEILHQMRRDHADLSAELKAAQQAQKEIEDQFRASEARNAKFLDEAHMEYSELEHSRDKLRKEITELKISHAQEVNQKSRSIDPKMPEEQEVEKPDVVPEGDVPLSKGQKKRKNKRKNVSKPEILEQVTKESEMLGSHNQQSSDRDTIPYEDALKERIQLRLEVDTMKAHMESFDDERKSLERKIKQLREHSESINDMRDMVRDVGDELVTAKDQVKALNREKADLQTIIDQTKSALSTSETRNAELAQQLANAKAVDQEAALNGNAQKGREDLESRLSASEERLRTVSRDLEIAEKLSAERFKELSTTKENLKQQSTEVIELKRQVTRSNTDKSTLESNFKTSEVKVKALERAERDRRDELEKSQKHLTSREKELKVIQAAFKEEEVRRKSEESRAAGLKAEVVKLTTLRDSIISSRNELTSQLSGMRADLDAANTKMASLQQLKNQLTLERDAAQEDLQLGKAKFESSFSLMESQREQTIDMQHRLRESTDRYEAMEEELSEAQRQLTERAREAETLRRLLSEIEAGQDSRLREMRERMEVALADRDKAEDEAAFNGKKRAREVEELKEKLLDFERAQRKLTSERQDLVTQVEDLQKSVQLYKSQSESKDRDAADLRETMTGLSHSLREAESQISTLEEERNTLRQRMKESATRLDRMTSEINAKDDLLTKLRNERAHMLDRQDSFQSPTQVSRVSHNRNDSVSSIPSSPAFLRTPSLQSVSLSDKPKEKAEVDREYIKNVLFQFLEHKDKRKYLMPAISKLLLLSKQQEGVFVNSLK